MHAPWATLAGFGQGWEWTKAKDVIRETMFSRIYQACKKWKQWTRRKGFFERMYFVRTIVMMTIEKGWKVGFGPVGKPYWMCCEEELSWRPCAFEAPF
jgi:hypothetical protein